MSNEKTTTALARVEPDDSALAMVMDPGEAVRRLKELQRFVAEVMVEGEDYGTIPGTPRPTLYQPGAQKMAEIYGLAVHFEDSRPPIEIWGAGGEYPFVAYFKRAIVTRRRDGLFLGDGIGQCNSQEKKYQKQDACSVANTIEKMACKRALVAGVLAVTRSSGLFTQDLEDGEPVPARTKKQGVRDAEYEDAAPAGRPARPSPPPVSPDVIRERARWAKDGGDENTERTLAASPDANDRAMVFEWRIKEAADMGALAAVVKDIERDAHDQMRAHMLAMADNRRGELSVAPAA